MTKIATIISRIFEPVVILTVLILIVLTKSGLEGYAFYRFIAIFFFLMVLPPMALLVWAVQTKKISNWDIGDRRQRVHALALFLLFQLFNVVLTWIFGNAYLLQIILLFCFWFLGFFLITLFWKISGHSGITTLGSLFMIQWFGVVWWPVLFSIPMVSWARVVRRDHTVGQVIAGVLYSLIFVLLSKGLGIRIM